MVESSTKGERGSLGATGVVCLAALLSGAAGLSYEVVWSRMLVVPLGNSSDATALVLCAFMLGMALGARLMGALSDKLASPLKVYVAAELALAVYAVAVPFMEPAILGNALPWILKMIIGLVLVAIPALLMGASIPVLVRGLSREGRDVPFNVGLIYGMNTLGGAGGAALAGFVAIPSLGLTASSFLAAAASATAALLVLAVVKLGRKEKKERSWAASAEEAEPESVPRITAVSALAAAGAGGFVMLGAEVIWARLLTFVFGHDTYAFATLLVVVLAGLGLGGALHRILAKRDPAKLTWLFLGIHNLDPGDAEIVFFKRRTMTVV